MPAKRSRTGRDMGSAGFTIVEVLISLMLIAIAVMSVGQIFAMGSRNVAMGRTETIAVSLVREISEKIMSEPASDLPSMFDGVDTAEPGTLTQPCEIWADHLAAQLGPLGRGRITVRDPEEDLSLLPGMFSVEVDVSWIAHGDTIHVPSRFAVVRMAD